MPTNTVCPEAADQHDVYHNYKFRLRWDGQYVAGVSKVSALTRTTQVITHHSGGDSSTLRHLPGQSAFAAITLERGITYDLAFEQWASKVWDYHNASSDDQQGVRGNPVVSLKDFRKDIVIEVYNGAGQKVISYNVYRCWPSEFVAMPEMVANGNAVAIVSLRLDNEGWESETSSGEPAEPNYISPAS